MRKNVFGRQLKRDANERKALFKNLLTSLVLDGRIKTTTAKAKAIRSAADKLVTKAKKGGTDAHRALAPDIRHEAAAKLITEIAPRFMTRQGGYTRIIRIGRRVADNAPMVLMEWTDQKPPFMDKALPVGKKVKASDKKQAEVKVKTDKAPKKETKKPESKKTDTKKKK
jgi:large subunit ribosomal protein L17